MRYIPWMLIVLLGCHVSLVNASELDELLESKSAKKTEIPVVTPEYLMSPGDVLRVFVWRNPELSVEVPVRPDGKISLPLAEDIIASGRTPSALARSIEEILSGYIRDPRVTVMITAFGSSFQRQVRVVGEAANPRALVYAEDMTLLDVVIAVGGLTEYAAGNRAKLVRKSNGKLREISVKLESLVKDGDIEENRKVLPGDILIIPEAWF